LLAENKNIDLGVDVAEEDLYVQGNVDSLRVMLGNVVDNAIRYTAKDGRIDVNVRKENHQILLSVSDNGMGIPAHDRERIFDRFYRCEGTGESGSGLGLAIVKNVADMHKATIMLSEAQVGTGLIFTIAFSLSENSSLS